MTSNRPQKTPEWLQINSKTNPNVKNFTFENKLLYIMNTNLKIIIKDLRIKSIKGLLLYSFSKIILRAWKTKSENLEFYNLNQKTVWKIFVPFNYNLTKSKMCMNVIL